MKFKRVISVAAAFAVMGTMLAGCGEKRTAKGEDPNKIPQDTYEINWYLMGTAQQDLASVEARVNEYLKDKINATLKIHRLESSQYTKKMSTMIAAGE